MVVQDVRRSNNFYRDVDMHGNDINNAGNVPATPGGADTQVQFNDGGAFGGDADFTFDKTTNTLTVNGRGIFTGGTGTNTFTTAHGLMFGYTNAYGEIQVGDNVADKGAFAGGYAKGQSEVNVSQIQATTKGAFAQGYAESSVFGSSHLKSSGVGSFAQGGIISTGEIYSSGVGSFAQGGIYEYGEIKSSGEGSFAQGYASGSYGILYASNKGSFAQGYGKNGINSTGNGSFAQGYAYYGNIISSGEGSFAQGKTYYALIKSYGNGSFAQGYASDVDIYAQAINTAQFGPGTNNEPNTLQTGTQVRIKGTTGAPADNLHNGDIWVANNYVYIRSNGVSCKCVNVAM